MPKLKVKKTRYDDTDYSKIVEETSLEDFAVKMHKRLVKATKVIKQDEDKIDSHSIKNLLADYPSLFSWAMVENRLIKQKFQEEQEAYDNKMKLWYDEYSEQMPKATQKAIDAAIYKDKTEELDKIKKSLREFDAKSKIASDLVSVWQSTVHTLQSLSKQVSLEMELSKMRHKHGA